MKILVTGAGGQVGSALLERLSAGRGHDFGAAIGIDAHELDLAKPGIETELERQFGGEKLSAIIHPAAYTQVDQAEKEPELAHAINAVAPGALARFAAGRGIPFVTYSTDYVYPGTGTKPWREDDAVGPLSVYGRTKLEGERAVAAAGGLHLIFRTSWVYDAMGKNFLNTMLRLGAERERLRVVADQWGAPTYAAHLAEATLAALERALMTGRAGAPAGERAFPSGVYHLCGGGETTWHGFAEAIFAGVRDRSREKGGENGRDSAPTLAVRSVEAITTAEFPTPAKRPANSRLDTSKAKTVLGVKLPDWPDGLRDCLERKFTKK